METIAIGGKNFDVEERYMDQQELVFYVDNPRVYSELRENGNDNPSQQEIEAKMRSLDHVKELRYQIEENGGLIEALFVVKRNDEYVVLEGNSRLAAYRLLADKDPIKWKQVRCNILPETITEADILTLLGVLHLQKKKDWSVYEQAAYVYREHKALGMPVSTIAKSVGLSKSKVKLYIDVYEFMVESNDNVQSHWNYYEQYVKSGGIKKYRETCPGIDECIVTQIKTGKITQAKDIRDKLGPIAQSSDKTAKNIMQDIIAERTTIYEGYERFEATGKSGNSYKKVKAFRDLMTNEDFLKALKKEAAGNNDTPLPFELKKINKAITKLLKELGE